MAHESFEDQEVADLLNESFIPVKVDKEERPDIDAVYMNVCLALTGSGGWPMTIFMDGEGRPFYAGTYFPKHSRYGMPGLIKLLTTISEQWALDKQSLIASAQKITAHLNTGEKRRHGAAPEPQRLVKRALSALTASFDAQYGGFGRAPKFPMAHTLSFLLRCGEPSGVDMAVFTLKKLYQGGIFDQIGFGFSRYATDEKWFIPHFEKMLYDNALLLLAYADAYRLTADPVFRAAAEKIVLYLDREMTSPEGAFYSAQDADSEGREGAYYLFTPGEIETLLGPEQGRRFCESYGIAKKGDLDGKSVPNQIHLPGPEDTMAAFLPVVYAYRQKRMALSIDDKILTSWNALMISALCEASQALQRPDLLDRAERAAAFVDRHLKENDRLFISFRQSRGRAEGILDDYAFYSHALLSLYRLTLKETYLQTARALCSRTLQDFFDPESGGFYLSGSGGEKLIARPKEVHDGALPSGNSVMAAVLWLLWQLTGETELLDAFEKQKDFLLRQAVATPENHTAFLQALLMEDAPADKITVVLRDPGEKEAVKRLLPKDALVTLYETEPPAYPLKDGQTTYYICRGHTCMPPTNTPRFPTQP